MAVDELGGIRETVGDWLKKGAGWLNPGGQNTIDVGQPPPEEKKFPWGPVILGTVSLAALIGVVYYSSKKRGK